MPFFVGLLAGQYNQAKNITGVNWEGRQLEEFILTRTVFTHFSAAHFTVRGTMVAQEDMPKLDSL